MDIESGFLLISEKGDGRWPGLVAAALAPFGHLQIASLKEALDLIQQQPRRMIIVDAAEFDNPSALVTQIREIHPKARVVVATASPTWRRAREAFRAGATYYVRKSSSQEELQEELAKALDITPPL